LRGKNRSVRLWLVDSTGVKVTKTSDVISDLLLFARKTPVLEEHGKG